MSIYAFDSELLDVALLDGAADAVSVPTDEIWYNYYGLANAAVITEFVKISAPDWALGTKSYPRADGSYQETAQFTETQIKIRGVIKRTTRTSLELEMDLMRKAFAKAGALLKITWAGVTRMYENCYAVSINTIFDGREHYHINFVPFEVTFMSLQPFGRSESRTVFSSPYAIDSSPVSYVLTNNGTAPTDPILFLTFSTIGTATTILVENLETGDSMTITGAWADGDLFSIDGENKTVKRNSVAVDYSGIFPRLSSGNNTYRITIDGAGFEASLTEQHYSRYY